MKKYLLLFWTVAQPLLGMRNDPMYFEPMIGCCQFSLLKGIVFDREVLAVADPGMSKDLVEMKGFVMVESFVSHSQAYQISASLREVHPEALPSLNILRTLANKMRDMEVKVLNQAPQMRNFFWGPSGPISIEDIGQFE